MARSSNWFKRIRRNFVKGSSKSSRNIIVVYSHISSHEEETTQLISDVAASITTQQTLPPPPLTKQDLAAIEIQAQFRGHLARRAFRALRSLVKLQAIVRGGQVRKQARIAMHCMNAMTRLQVSVRARQLFAGDSSISNNNRLTLQRHLF
ncbi:hypothetical protein CsatB_004958 [Cannabis sativa]|uniref:Uncharacterized protein n=2 Tax=Cannabis sativa TaxID=3483 RepID=A0A7J6FVV0_CANSA|nr:hypothetical protein F8388_007725 [Cannabis sativa]